jgi:LmbE family N-acetylglucosaminyl deacetylase
MAANEPGQPAVDHPDPLISSRDLPVPASALAIGAHPDDVEFGAGGTLAKWAAAGCIVHHLVCTDGSKGTWDVNADTVALVARRQDEQRAAARQLSGEHAGQVVFLGHVDGELDSSLAVRSEVARVIRELKPEVVLGHDPWKQYRLHPDHRHAGLLACEAIVAARDPHFYREHGLPHHRPSAVLLWEAERPNHVEDVTATVDRKLAALEAHVSQFESTMKATDESQLLAFRARIRARLAEHGLPYDLAAAEVFRSITDL